jgi:hypothetical protein
MQTGLSHWTLPVLNPSNAAIDTVVHAFNPGSKTRLAVNVYDDQGVLVKSEAPADVAPLTSFEYRISPGKDGLPVTSSVVEVISLDPVVIHILFLERGLPNYAFCPRDFLSDENVTALDITRSGGAGIAVVPTLRTVLVMDWHSLALSNRFGATPRFTPLWAASPAQT